MMSGPNDATTTNSSSVKPASMGYDSLSVDGSLVSDDPTASSPFKLSPFTQPFSLRKRPGDAPRLSLG
jgi:hypothetical protein